MHAGYARRPKFSRSQKERAVEHYLEHGHCLAVTIRALGYPSRGGVLLARLQELHPEARTRVVGRSGGRAPLDRQAAVIALCMRQGSAKSVAQKLGLDWAVLDRIDRELLGVAD